MAITVRTDTTIRPRKSLDELIGLDSVPDWV